MRLVIKGAEEQVYEALRDEIVHGLSAGTSLQLAPIAARLGVSTMPVRVAIQRLKREGFVRHERGRGAVVAPLEIEDIQEIQAIRTGLEGLAARVGAEQIDDAGIGRMRELFDGVRSAARRRNLDEYYSVATEFEDELYRGSNRPRLLKLVQDYRRAAQRYVLAPILAAEDFRIDVHRELLDAAVAHNGSAADLTRRRDLEWTYEQLASSLTRTDKIPS